MGKAYRMSSAQKRLFISQQLKEENTSYNIPMMFEIKGELNIKQLENSFNNLIKRHELLRTFFVNVDDRFLQLIEENINLNIPVVTARKDDIQILFKNFVRSFDLSKAPLMRVQLLHIEENYHILFFDVHHIICDGGSTGILFGDLSKLYNGTALPEQKVQYKNFSSWKSKQDLSKEKQYWINELTDKNTQLNLNTDYLRPVVRNFTGDNILTEIPKDIHDKLKAMASKTGATDFMVLLSAFLFFLNKYSLQNNITVGFPVSGRTHPDSYEMLGMFVNTVVINSDVNAKGSFLELLKQVQEKSFNAFANQDYPFEQLIDDLGIERDPSRNPLFDVMFSVANNDHQIFKLGNVELKPVEFDYKISKFDLTANLHESEGKYQLYWEYSTDLFKRSTVELMINQFIYILSQLLDNPKSSLNSISLVSEQDIDEINKINNTKVNIDVEKNIVDLFNEQLLINNTKNAIVDQSVSLTYKELDEITTRVSKQLIKNGVRPNEFVTFIADRDINSIISMLSIAKSGAAYVPIDVKYPSRRINEIVNDSECIVLLVSKKNIDAISSLTHNAKVLILEDIMENEEIDLTIEVINKPDDIAYMIYTSGTSGKPKGVMIKHISINRLVKGANYINFKNMKLVPTGSFAFDASTFEVWGTLLNGGTLHIFDEEMLLDSYKLKEKIEENNITTMWLTSSLFNQFVNDNPTFANSLRDLIIGGEALSLPHLQKIRLVNNKTNIVNGYGPTETTTFAITHKIPNILEEKIPIGSPISNTSVYIMHEDKLCPIGMPGEIHIGGLGVAKGYRKREELTLSKFITSPLNSDDKLYKTGDIGLINHNGEIEYLGRIDNQIKLRGYRIELSEIKKQIGKIDGVKSVAVVLIEIDGDKHICSYISMENPVDQNEIKNLLRETLPEYMIPTVINFMNEIPITINGKLDYRKLPKPVLIEERDIILPENEKEQVILDCMLKVLGKNSISTEDSFIDLGGDSIKAIKLVSQLRTSGYSISVREIITLRTVKQLAQVVKSNSERQYDQNEISGSFKFTPIQKKFMTSNVLKPNHFNQSILLESKNRIDMKALELTINQLVKHHDVLRSMFTGDNQIIRPYKNSHNYDLSKYDIKTVQNWEENIDTISESIQSDMNINTGDVFKVAVFETEKYDFILLTFHHLIIDAVSLRIIIEDMENVYANACINKPSILPLKTLSFMGWSKYLYDAASKIDNDYVYWQEQENNLAKSRLIISKTREKMRNEIVSLSESMTNDLKYKAQRVFNSDLQELLIGALARTIKNITNNEYISFNLEGHGRESITYDIDIDRTVGWFTSLYPIVIKLNNEQDIIRDLDETINVFRSIPNKGVTCGIYKMLFEQGNTEYPLSDITFNYLGEFQREESTSSNFKISDINHGRDIDENNNFGAMIDISASIFDNKLQVVFLPNKGLINNKEFIEKLAEEFNDQIQKIIDFSKNQKIDDVVENLSEVEKVLLNSIEKEVIFREIIIDSRKNKILFVSDLDVEMKNKIIEVLKGNSIQIDDYPDFIVHIDMMANINNKMEIGDFSNKISRDVVSIEHNLAEIFYQEIYSNQCVNEYISSALQLYYINNLRLNIEESFTIETLCEVDEIINAMLSIVKNQDSLRTNIVNGMMRVYSIETYNIPYFDLRMIDSNELDRFRVNLKNLRESNDNLNKDKLLSQLVLTRLSEKEYKIYFIGSHAVWDKTSSELMKSKITRILGNNLPVISEEHDNKFSQYIDEINFSGIEKITFINDDIGLLEKLNKVIDYSSNNDIEISHSQISSIVMGPKLKELYEKYTWKAVYYIIKVLLESQDIDKETTLFILQEERRYMNKDYSNLLGVFLDMMPVDICSEVDLGIQISSLQNIKKKHGVNYLNLLSSSGANVKDIIERTLTINYQGVYEINLDMFDKLNSMGKSKGSTEIYINHFRNYIVLSYPVIKGSSSELEKVLQKKIYELETQL